MRYGVCVPNIGEFAEPRQVAGLARRAEEAGWDGFFVWDHVVFPFGALEVGDPWVLLTLVAAETERIRFGPLVTAAARRRPGVLARQTTSLDRLSGGRLVFGAGLGFTLEAEFGTWGEPVEPAQVAGRLDESLAVLELLWSGEKVDFHGEYVTAADVTFQPTPVQRPRPPVWIGCNWPNRRPLDRAARWDGVAPMMISPADGSWDPTPEAVTELVTGVGKRRDGTGPFDVVITGRTPAERPGEARTTVEAIGAAGATWWLEGFRPQPGEYGDALRRIEAGPPRS
ncbi:LLM class flavin-dependent oxidoreductase [Actinomadura sp. 7K507]|uniref:LLM class flavin-dependent oxidoreductase n=1 Tax=Actinomadura sp. 7K507 TaxID=2530365 RepID=UPI00104893BA|nr:LLM class flavin-dependent oxidoreductase [Actinomadura sp. 7K507]TDC97804.1 LLM class flavin-dependent oxidoreductase [Actinomadura sp. 7K507]